jgi:hypothetical protein
LAASMSVVRYEIMLSQQPLLKGASPDPREPPQTLFILLWKCLY